MSLVNNDNTFLNLSTFPSSLDEFVVKKVFDPAEVGANQEAEALCKAVHFNHYYAACVKMMRYMYGRIGGPVYLVGTDDLDVIPPAGLSRTSSLDASGYISYATFSITPTSSASVVSGSVPSQFGANPFTDPKFGIIHSIEINPAASGTEDSGYWASGRYSDGVGPWSQMLLNQISHFVSIEPTTGSDFNLHVRNINWSTDIEGNVEAKAFWTDTYVIEAPYAGYQPEGRNSSNRNYYRSKFFSVQTNRTVNANVNTQSHPLANISNSGDLNARKKLVGTDSYYGRLQLGSDLDGRSTYSLLLVNQFASQDQEVLFKISGRDVTTANSIAGRVGPILRAVLDTTTPTPPSGTLLASGYMLCFGDTASGAAGFDRARIMRIADNDITDNYCYATRNTASTQDSTWEGGGSATQLGATINFTGLAQSTWIRFRASGSVISVASGAADTGPWTTVLSATDGAPMTPVDGQAGLLAKSTQSLGVLYFANPTIFRSLGSPASYQPITVKLLYTQVT